MRAERLLGSDCVALYPVLSILNIVIRAWEATETFSSRMKYTINLQCEDLFKGGNCLTNQ